MSLHLITNCRANSLLIIIFLYSNLSAQKTLEANKDTVCFNDVVKISSVLTDTIGISFNWQFKTATTSWDSIKNIQCDEKDINKEKISLKSFKESISFDIRCVYKNNSLQDSISNILQIKILPNILPPVISTLSQPICYNTAPNKLTLITNATGGDGNFIYQWQDSTASTKKFSDIGGPGKEYPTLALKESTWFRVVAKSTCSSVFSNISKITVYNDIKAPVISSLSQPICYNTSPTKLTLITEAIGGDGNFIYQWQDSTATTKKYNDIGVPGKEYQSPALTQTTWFRVVTKSACSSVFSNVTKITVYPKLTPGKISGNQDICDKGYTQPLQTITNTTGGSGTNNYTYQWQSSLDSIDNWVDITGETKKDFDSRSLSTSNYYRLETIDSCDTVFTNAVKVTVHTFPKDVTIKGSTCVCSNEYADYTIEQDLNPEYKYEWSVIGGQILSSNSVNVKTISVHWLDKNNVNDIVKIIQTVLIAGCQKTNSFQITKLSSRSPDRSEIIRKSKSNILISEEKGDSVHFKWGYTSLKDKNSTEIGDSDRRYAQYPISIDTTKYSYWVKASRYYAKDTCNSISIYLEKIKPNSVQKSNEYIFYPNPTKREINIVKQFDGKTNIIIKLFSVTGISLYQETINDIEVLNKKFDLNLPKGIYFIQISDKDIKTTQKLIIE